MCLFNEMCKGVMFQMEENHTLNIKSKKNKTNKRKKTNKKINKKII